MGILELGVLSIPASVDEFLWWDRSGSGECGLGSHGDLLQESELAMNDLTIIELAAAVNHKNGLPVATSPVVPVEPHRYNSFAPILDRYPFLFEAQLYHRVPETALAMAEMVLAIYCMSLAWGIDLKPLIIEVAQANLEGSKVSVERVNEIIGDLNGR